MKKKKKKKKRKFLSQNVCESMCALAVGDMARSRTLSDINDVQAAGEAKTAWHPQRPIGRLYRRKIGTQTPPD